MKILKIIAISTLLFGCGAQKKVIDPTIIYSACSLSQENSGLCSRFMDRDIYFVENGNLAGDNIKNNPLDIEKVKASLRDFACNTELGCNYFIFHTASEEELMPITGYSTGANFKSFIQIWPDSYPDGSTEESFGSFYLKTIPNPAEPNAMVVQNASNKKQFYMILKGSCFLESGSSDCTANPGTAFTSDLGLTALIARNMGRLVGIPLESDNVCVKTPLDLNVMCGRFPSNGQWSVTEKGRMTSLFNNALETIALNPNYYSQTFLEDL